jgi:hypothetical protein
MSEKRDIKHPLRGWQFYAECLRYAGSGFLGVIGDASTILGVMTLAVKLALPSYYSRAATYFQTHGYREDLLIEIPLWLGAGILLVRLIAAPFMIYRDKPSSSTQDAPNLQIAPAGFYEDTRTFQMRVEGRVNDIPVPAWKPIPASMLHLRLINEATGLPSERAVARDVVARLHFLALDGHEMFFMDGRWADSTQPPDLQHLQAAIDLLSQTIGIGLIRELDVAFKIIEHDVAYAFNNDSYIVGLENSARRLPPGEYKVRVHVMGPLLNKEWTLPFRVGDKGERLQVLT